MQPFQIDHRIGIVVPPSNPSVEPEMRALLSTTVALHTTRLPLLSGDLRARLEGYLPHFSPCLASFGDLNMDAYYIGVTGSAYAGGYPADIALCDELSRGIGAPVRTASLAIVEALKALKCETITLLSPYPDWLTQRSKSYWQSAGINVEHTASITSATAPGAHVYALDSRDIAAALARVPAGAATILMTGTGLVSLPTILSTPQDEGAPALLSSNICGAWWLTRQLKSAPAKQLADASPRLAHLLGT